MAEKGFGVKEVNLIGASGTPTITSPNNLNLNAVNVAISTNATIGGTLSVTGNVSVGGTLTYEDVTNIDSVGIITARTGVKVLAGGLNVVGVSYFNNNIVATATTAISITAADESSDTSCNVLFSTAATGNVAPKTGTNLTFNSSNGTLTATTFSGSGASLTSLPAANITGTLPAISGANLTGIAVTEAPVVDYTVTANGSSAYRFHGGGVDETADDPDLYLVRGQKYRFNNTTGSSHPFAIREASGGSAYSNGVTGSNQGVQFFTVPYDAPAKIFYQCTVHSGMVGNIYLRDAGGQNTNVGLTTFVAGIDVDGGNVIIKKGSDVGNIIQMTGADTTSEILEAGIVSGHVQFTASYAAGGSNSCGFIFRTRNGSSGTAERLRIDSSGNVNIGPSAAPRKRLDITGPDGRSGASSGNSDTALLIDNDGTNGAIIEMMADNNAYGRIFFTDTDASNRGQIVYEHTNDALFFATAGTERLRITSDGKIGVNATTTALIAPTYTLDLGGNDGSLDTSEQNTLRIRCNNGGTAIRVGPGGGGSRVTLLRADGESSGNLCFGETDKSAYGVSLVYHGDRSGNENSFAVYMDQSTNANQVEAFNIRQNADYMFGGNSYSDRDHKENITSISGTALDKITQLSPKTWNWKTEYHNIPTDRIFAGFIAQEVQPHIPSIVTGTDGQEDMAIDYQGLLAWTIKALTELKSENDNLKARVNTLEGS